MNHFNAAERHGARNQIQRIAGRTANPVGQLSGSANAAHGFCLAVGSAALFNAPQPQQDAARVGPAAGRQFNAADARSRATHLRTGWSPSAETHPCKSQMQKHGPEMPARRSSARPAALFNGRNAGVDRIGERGAVGDVAHAVGALICARPHAKTARRTKREIDTRPSTHHVHYGCTKSRVGASDAGSIPATSTTMGVQGFDGALIRDGQPAMVPAASGSPLSRGPVRWAKSKLPTTTAITSSALRDVPAGRGVTNAGTLGGSDALKPKHSDLQRPARFAAVLCRVPRPFSSLHR